MLPSKRLGLASLLLISVFAFTSIQCLTGDEIIEGSIDKSVIKDEEIEEADFDFYDETENESILKQDYPSLPPNPDYLGNLYQARPVYQPVAPAYQPAYQPAPQAYVSTNYVPPPTNNYVSPVSYNASYVQPVQEYVQPVQTYTAPVQTYTPPVQTYTPPVQNYTAPVQNYTSAPVYLRPLALQSTNYTGLKTYSVADLAPFLTYAGYHGNHWSLIYYRASPYRTCPKNIYLNGPTYKDIEAAFIYAQQQLALGRKPNLQYLNSTSPTFAGRHQVFSFLSQTSSRMDEEGLLVEFVSYYLSDRACLTKWDKQRYLPQLTRQISVSNFPEGHSCYNYFSKPGPSQIKTCSSSKYRTIDGFCNNPYHPYWGKANICHIRLLSPDYADGIATPRISYNPRFQLPNPRAVSNYVHNEVPVESEYNLMKMQWGQFINHDITNTALSSYDGLIDCCKNPNIRGCYPIYVPPGDPFYAKLNVTCLSFIRSGVCPLCQLGPRQQFNKNTAFIDLSSVYGSSNDIGNLLRTFRNGQLRTSYGKDGQPLLPVSIGNGANEQCAGSCFFGGDSRVNQQPGITTLQTLMLRNHNHLANALYARHPNWNDEYIYQEARRLNIAEYQMITYNEYLPIVFGPVLSAYFDLVPLKTGYTYYDIKTDPTTWNEYATATCRFGHSQIQSTMGLYSKILAYGQKDQSQPTFRLKDWFMRTTFMSDGMIPQLVNGMLGVPAQAVDPWVTTDVRNHLYQGPKEYSGGDLAATNIQRGRDHGIPGYIHYLDYCFNYKVRGWKDLMLFIPTTELQQIRKLYRVVENIDLFTGGLAEWHFPGADIGPTFACINGLQYYHLKHGDRYYFEHGSQAGSFTPIQLDEIRRSTLARLLCRTANIPQVPQYAFLQPSQYNPLVNCSMLGDFDYSKF